MIRFLIAELYEAISDPAVRQKYEAELDRLADRILLYEKDDYYVNHPEEQTNGQNIA